MVAFKKVVAFNRSRASRPGTNSALRGARGLRHRCWSAVLLTSLCAGILLSHVVVQAQTSTSIILYSPNGPINVTATDTIVGPHIYDEGVLVGTIDAYGYIWNPANELIGFVETDS